MLYNPARESAIAMQKHSWRNIKQTADILRSIGRALVTELGAERCLVGYSFSGVVCAKPLIDLIVPGMNDLFKVYGLHSLLK